MYRMQLYGKQLQTFFLLALCFGSYCSSEQEAPPANKRSWTGAIRNFFSYAVYGQPALSSYDKEIVERTLDCSGPITTLTADTFASVRVVLGDTNKVVLRTPRYLSSFLQEQYSNGALTLDIQQNSKIICYQNNSEYTIYITDATLLHNVHNSGAAELHLPSIGSSNRDTTIINSGAGKLTVEGKNPVQGRNVILEESGAGNLIINKGIVAQKSLKLGKTGASKTKIGKIVCNDAAIKSSGAGVICLTEIDTKSDIDCQLIISGAGGFNCTTWNSPSANLNLTLSGAGNVYVGSLRANNIILYNTGAVDFKNNELCAENLKVKNSGTTDISCQNVLVTNKVEIINSGVMDLYIAGTCKNKNIKDRGTSDLNLYNLKESNSK